MQMPTMQNITTTKITPMRVITLIVLLTFCLQTSLVIAQNKATVTVQVDKPGADISPTMFGIFFEDINFGADGGLYPERVKNRSFEFPEPLMGWQKAVASGGTFEVRTDDP